MTEFMLRHYTYQDIKQDIFVGTCILLTLLVAIWVGMASLQGNTISGISLRAGDEIASSTANLGYDR